MDIRWNSHCRNFEFIVSALQKVGGHSRFVRDIPKANTLLNGVSKTPAGKPTCMRSVSEDGFSAEQNDIGPAKLGKMVRRRTSHDAAADDNGARVSWKIGHLL